MGLQVALPFCRPCRDSRVGRGFPTTEVVGYSRPSLRDYSWPTTY